ncbi:hypothetical protein OOK44_11615 [Streptomyces cellulosae]|uniref:hypothetical protein n=1 Tax=Streptomyces cellulosae TaxID=1968 RepID=UPI0022583F77|nr:hypothetical protein [Streptomyces cellulosae]WTB83882.1 hypothetical protein OG837_22800 [Streptomyces cellulosae]WTB90727.1 hypothetical protein OIE99_22025 [Streptomyces cellulosae]WTC58078.1 hypothetical protein OH715_23710 [Streptomyces cellulosae]
MKPLNAAVILAGAVAVACAATPAVAHEGSKSPADGLAGAAKQVADGPVQAGPDERSPYLVGTQEKAALAKAAQQSGPSVVQKTDGSLLGGLPVA